MSNLKEEMYQELEVLGEISTHLENYNRHIAGRALLHYQLEGRESFNDGDLAYIVYPSKCDIYTAHVKLGKKYIHVLEKPLFGSDAPRTVANINIEDSIKYGRGIVFCPDYRCRVAFLFFNRAGMSSFLHRFKDLMNMQNLLKVVDKDLMYLTDKEFANILTLLSKVKTRSISHELNGVLK